MANPRQNIQHAERSDSLSHLSNQRARERARPPSSVYSNLRANLRESPLRMASLQYTRKAEADAYLYTHIHGTSGLQKWPIPRSKSLQSLRIAADQQSSPFSPAIPYSNGTNLLPGASLPARKEVAKHSRRKASLPDLNLGHMTTVQEGVLDSPTLPGLHPTIIRSLSFPDTKLRQVPEETSEETSREQLTPRCYHESPEEIGTESSDKVESERRRSSMIFLHNMDGLGITSSAEWRKSFKTYKLTPSCEQLGKPPQVPPKSPKTGCRASPQVPPKSPKTGCRASPQVPPKSPRTVKRAFPRPKRKPLHSATSSVSTACSTSSAETSVSSKSSMCVPISVEGPVSKAASDSIKKISAEPLPCLYDGGRRTPPHKATTRCLPCNPRSDGQDLSNAPLPLAESSWYRESFVSTDEASESKEDGGRVDSLQWHAQRRVLEPSVIDDGRPIQSGGNSLMHNLSKLTIRRPSLSSEETAIPKGTKVQEATDNLPITDLSILRQLANERVEGFRVLSMEDLSNLSKELTLLEERIQYLRHTYASLRAGRKGLRERVLAYLRSPRLLKACAGSIIRQEEVLAELDIAIDEWVSKLEQAEHRRWKIQQKLLEHVAATLTVVDSTSINAGPTTNTRALQQSKVLKEKQTLPTTAQEPILTDESLRACDSSSSHSHSETENLQTVRVYADTGVAVLLSAIEDEILLMQKAGPARAATC